MLKPTISRLYFLIIGMLILQVSFIAHLNAQIVIGGDTIDQSAVLDIQDTARGILLSRLTTEQRNAIIQPAFGLLILNTTRKCVETNMGSPDQPNWKCLTMGIPEITELDTLYWNTKLNAKDTISLSNRIDGIAGLPTSGNTTGDILFWNGQSWEKRSAGQDGQVLQLINGVPTWAGVAFARLTTDTASSITTSTATLGGYIISDGGAAVTSRGLVYSTSPTPTLSNSVLNAGSGTGSFSSTITGLTPNTTYYVRAFATNSAGTVYGNEVQFTTEANILEDKVIDVDGNIYNTIQIGNQVWMKENLRVAHYQNGDLIPAVKNIDTWNSASSGLRGWYNNDSTAYNAVYGALYNWSAAVDVRGVCPTGWHVPSDAEWTTLSNYLGGAVIAGGKMKATGTTAWNSPNEGATNESGFSALPASNPYEVVGNAAYFWSSTDYNGFAAWNRVLVKDHGGLIRQPNDHVYAAWYQIGVSIRCLRN